MSIVLAEPQAPAAALFAERVDIVIPVYNEQDSLERAGRSRVGLPAPPAACPPHRGTQGRYIEVAGRRCEGTPHQPNGAALTGQE